MLETYLVCSPAEREDGRLNAEKRRIAAEVSDLREKMNGYENSLFRTTQHIEQMKQQMKWDQEALDEWIAVATRKDEDTMVLQKYTKIDDSKTKVRSHRSRGYTCRQKLTIM